MNYHNIKHDDMVNGDGIRVTLFVSGCSHHCLECQNPQTWDFSSGVFFDEEAEEELFSELSKDYISGITFSGGDPIDNFVSIYVLMKKIKEKFPDKTIWCYTGYTYEYLIHSTSMKNYLGLLEMIDVLVDGEYKKDLRDVQLKWRGSSNQRVIDVKKSLAENKVVLWCD